MFTNRQCDEGDRPQNYLGDDIASIDETSLARN